MTLSIQEVEHIAELARLKLSPEEIERYREQLSDILDYAARLQEVDTTDILPTSGVSTTDSTLREDTSRNGLSTQRLLENAPQTKDNQFRVPPVLD